MLACLILTLGLITTTLITFTVAAPSVTRVATGIIERLGVGAARVSGILTVILALCAIAARSAPQRASVGVEQHQAFAGRSFGDFTRFELLTLPVANDDDFIAHCEGDALGLDEVFLAELQGEELGVGGLHGQATALNVGHKTFKRDPVDGFKLDLFALGLLPLAVFHGAHVGDAEYYPMAWAIIGGLASSTLLTLLVLAVKTWGLVALAMTALATVPLIFATLILITLGK